MFWRHKKTDPKGPSPKDKEDKIFHHEGEEDIERPLEEDTGDSLHETDSESLPEEGQGLDEVQETPLPHAGSAGTQQSKEKTEGGGWWSRLTTGLSKSTNKLTSGISDLVTKKKLDQDTLNALEDLLISADLGPKTSARLVAELSESRFGKEVTDEEIKRVLADSIDNILEPVAANLDFTSTNNIPKTIVICGVNGVGKTTTIGKLAHHLVLYEKKTALLAAGDTFRAAAVEQLQEWGKRTHAPVLAKEIGADSASVAYEAYARAKEEGRDVLMVDTAGRLHNKSHLMDELQKITRVLKKQDETLPHEVLLVLDATTGQNAHAQVKTFKEMVNITGIIVTKLDGSAKGGVLVSLADEFKLPVYAIGVGEQAEDMQSFHPREYANALLGIEAPFPE